MAVVEPHASKAGRDCRSGQFMVVQRHVTAWDKGGSDASMDKAVCCAIGNGGKSVKMLCN